MEIQESTTKFKVTPINQHFSLSIFMFLNVFFDVNSLFKGIGGMCKVYAKNSTS
jgi:hypothetical protein